MTRHRVVLAVAACLLAAACGDQSARTPVQPDFGVTSGVSQIQSRMSVLFGAGDLGASGVSQLGGIQQAISDGNRELARARMLGLVRFTLRAYLQRRLQDPNGANPPTTLDAVCELTSALYRFVEVAGPVCAAADGDHDHAQAVIGHDGGLITTPRATSGANFPPGALLDPVLVIVSRLPDSTTRGHGPINTVLDQYPPFYEFATFPETRFNGLVLVGVCVFDPPNPNAPTPEVAARLRLAHNTHSGRAELLPLATAFFLGCVPNSDGSVRSPGGLGGLTGSFSPFGAVDPGENHGGGDEESR